MGQVVADRGATGVAAPPPAPAGTGGRTLATRLHWALRVGVAMEFVGHGLAGLAHSKAWIPYFTIFGFSRDFSQHHLMYLTGTVDIALALLTLYRPMRAVLLHMTFWGLMTAWLRPLTGESWFELVERGANYGMPLAFLLMAGWGGRSWRTWFERVRPPASLDEGLARRLEWVMRVSIALLLVGHGGLGIWAHKKEWLDFFGFFGIGTATVASAHLSQWVGAAEIALGLAALYKPLRGVLVVVLVWKVGTEALRPLVGQNNYQFIERGGDYALPLGLFWLLGWCRRGAPARDRRPA
ncbi:MAG: hypothetical protein LC792_15920, partial [Actinobacteria bacterium]|nr:hypothetical protein [Actinomycetota bacterium]